MIVWLVYLLIQVQVGVKIPKQLQQLNNDEKIKKRIIINNNNVNIIIHLRLFDWLIY